ncbi:MAG: primosomal protein N' [Firmicutes bacterium]|nr:primosomal protein N' [Bacillota bacterium]
MRYVKVIIDHVSDHTDMLFTYRCPFDQVAVGSVVEVPFGKGNKKKKAYVFEVSDENTEGLKNLKDVSAVDEAYVIPEDLIDICRWMKETYLCRYIDAIKCVIPVGDAAKRGKRKDPYADLDVPHLPAPELTSQQQNALDTILPAVAGKTAETFLINGVTSSGKTEIYMRVAEQVLNQGRDVIILVPEISLTPQTIHRFVGRFGSNTVAVLHSKMTKGQRYDQWIRVRNGGARILIGARSGIFAPFENLGAIIIDEEHELAYKSDMTPKYDAIDAALERARLKDGIVILGSATPSVVSRYRAEKGIYTEIRLTERYNKTPLPFVHIADMRQELKQGNRSIFSVALYQKIKESLDAGKQAILFLNRRGYSSFVSCRSCGYVMKCDTCGVSLTYHKASGMAECHYCGRRVRVPSKCPSCTSPYIRHFGIGTERVEEAARETFPEAKVARLDLDTARRKGETDRILNSFRKGETQILVGTQLVAKGLDFDNVGVVGIIAADISLNIPDYRSAERTYQLIVQAAGRAGRGYEAGQVVIQTYSPDDRTILAAAADDHDAFYRNEVMLRRVTGYPPFTNIIRLVFNGQTEEDCIREASAVYDKIISSELAKRGELLSPQPAYMTKLNETWRYHVIIKSPVQRTNSYLELISQIKSERLADNSLRTTMLVEIDPYSFT